MTRSLQSTLGSTLLLLNIAACAPTFSELQSARLAGRGRVELTPSYSSTSYTEDGETEKVQDHYGVQIATGIAPRVDARFRYERIAVEDASVNVIGAGPKISLAQDRWAVYVPVGFAFGSDIEASETFQIHPTLLGTATFGPHVELTASGKVLIPFDREFDDLVAFNLGLGLGPDLDRWVIRPEAGVLLNPGESGAFWHLSIGFTAYLGRSAAALR